MDSSCNSPNLLRLLLDMSQRYVNLISLDFCFLTGFLGFTTDEDQEKSDFGSSALSIIINVLVFMCVAVLIVIALIKWRKRCAAGKCQLESLFREKQPSKVYCI